MGKETLLSSEDFSVIPVGALICDAEDSDLCYYGVWLGDNKYKIIACNMGDGIETDAEIINQIQEPVYYYIDILDK